MVSSSIESGDVGSPTTDAAIPGRSTYLRAVERSDGPLLRFLLNDPSVNASFVGFNVPVSTDDQRRWTESPRREPNGPWHFTIVERTTGTPVGLTQLHTIDWRLGSARDGIKLHPSAMGRGLAYDACMARNAWAFFVAGLRRLEASVLDFNEPSHRLFRRLGYAQEGRRREAVLKNGRWCDLLDYGLLRSEAEAVPAMAEYRALVAPAGATG